MESREFDRLNESLEADKLEQRNDDEEDTLLVKRPSVESISSSQHNGWDYWSAMRSAKYVFFRVLIVVTVLLLSFLVENINTMLVIGGSIIGTLVTIVIPVLFYNRAYSDDEKNLIKHSGDDVSMSRRKMIRRINYCVIFIGVSISALGLLNAIQDLLKGRTKLTATI